MSAHDRYLQRALVLAKQNIADGGSGSSGTLLRRRPLRTERASFPALRSSLYKCFR